MQNTKTESKPRNDDKVKEVMNDLPWAKVFNRRCRALKAPDETGFYGRCELKPHSTDIEHALERGMVWVRWFDSPIRLEEPHYENTL